MMLALTLLSLASRAGEEAVAGIIAFLIILMIVLGGLTVYFLPTIIALFRHHHQWGAITVINLFFGWTFIGWVLTLAWAVSAGRERYHALSAALFIGATSNERLSITAIACGPPIAITACTARGG